VAGMGRPVRPVCAIGAWAAEPSVGCRHPAVREREPTVVHERAWHLDADNLLTSVCAEAPDDRLEDPSADASADLDAQTVLDLGSGSA
jgi:hypothetical protein